MLVAMAVVDSVARWVVEWVGLKEVVSIVCYLL